MEERRFRLYISIFVTLFLLVFARVASNSNPIYGVLEPVWTWLSDISAEVSLSSANTASPDAMQAASNVRLQQENEQLRQQLGLQTQLPITRAEVTQRDLLGFRKFVWVSAGKDDGIKRGQTVMTNGSLFGVVEDVFENSARIKTILDPDFRATVRVGQERGVIKVEWGSLIVDLVPTKEATARPVQTDGLDGQVIAGIPVGILGEQINDAAEVFGAYSLQLPFDIYSVSFVEVVQTGNQE